MSIDLSRHPCFNDAVRHQFGRVHLPVAPKCNIQCNYCDRKYDCANENRPGVTSDILSPDQALFYLKRVIEKDPRIAVMGIAGPGDAFASPEETLQTLKLVRKEFPQLLLCVATNGLNLSPYVDELAQIDVSHVTITLNAVDPSIGEKIYAWVRDKKRVYRGYEAASLLLKRQLEAIQRLKEKNIVVKINSILIPGINENHIGDIAATVSGLGADILNCIPIYPVENTPFAELGTPNPTSILSARKEAGTYLPQMHHCTRCRADAVGLLGEDMPVEIQKDLHESSVLPLNPSEERPYVAVASHEGLLVNQHLGEAKQLFIFHQQKDSFACIARRPTPPAGDGINRWMALGDLLQDCRALLVNSAGDTPRTVLQDKGIRVVMMEGLIEEGLDAIYRNQEIRSPLRSEHRCGSGCAGTGTGCL